MKKKVLSAVIATVIIISSITSTGFVVKAAPITENASKYEELSAKVKALEEKVEAIDNQISPLVDKINNNKSQVQNINKDIEQTNKDIEQAKVDIAAKEEVLGKRLREIYKTGGQTSYISLLFSADSFSDLISKIDSAGRIVNIDKKVVEEVVENKDKLDTQVKSLETKANEILKINEQVEKQKAEFDQKKEEQQPLVNQAIAEKAEFDKLYLSVEENNIVKPYMDICNDSNKSSDDLKAAISTLRSIRDNQPLRSESVKVDVKAAILNALKLIEDKPIVVNRGSSTSGNTSGIVAFAEQYIGRPYVWGAKGASTFDCSGFTSYIYRNFSGIEIGGDTYSQVTSGREVSQSDLQPGDLIFPHSGHVEMYIGNGQVIHAPRSGYNVTIAPLGEVWRARRIVN